MGDEEVAEAIACEVQLLTPAVRSSRERAARLLDPDYVEVGASGRRRGREELLAALPEMPGADGDGPPVTATRMAGVRLAPGVVHVTYEAAVGVRRSYRSSIWRRTGDRAWRILYHQGTPVPGGA